MRFYAPARLLASVALVLLAAAQLNAAPGDLTLTVDFDTNDVAVERAEGLDVVRMAGAVSTFEEGRPELPVSLLRLALPPGTVAVSATAEVLASSELDGYFNVRPRQPQTRLSDPVARRFVEPDLAVYGSSSLYPVAACVLLDTGTMTGRPVATVAVHPVQYSPANGRLTVNESIRITVSLADDPDRSTAPLLSERAAGVATERLRAVVSNAADVHDYDVRPAGMRAETVDYLIVTGDSYVSTFQNLADWKTMKGVSTEIVTTSWIYSNYTGVDDQEKIRNCIIDYHQNHGTMWVLLGGDTSVVPVRTAYAKAGDDGENLKCDLYYSDLDGTWNADGDDRWGEVGADAIDMYADVFVGRAPVDTSTEATRFVNKILTYEGAPGGDPLPTDYQKNMLFLAEVLWDTPFTDHGICKNMIDDESVPTRFDPITKLYETNGLLTKSNAIAELNSGHNIINHNGHANYYVMSIGSSSFYRSDFDNLTNSPRYGIMYSIGCWAAALDYDAIGEHWVNSPGGGFAFVGNSRYGWGSPGNPGNGTSDEFDREFFNQLFNEGLERAGVAHAAHKDALVGVAKSESYTRYALYELNLLGDPETRIWTEEPTAAVVRSTDTIPLGPQPFVVTVSRGGAPVAGAMVLLSSDDIHEVAETSAEGVATLYPEPTLEGTLSLVVTGQGIVPVTSTISIVSGSEDTTAPDAVDQLAAADPFDLGGMIQLDWSGYTPPADFAYYRVYRSESGFFDVGGRSPIVAAIIDEDQRSWDDATAENGVPYYYAVTAIDLTGNELEAVTSRGPIAATVNSRVFLWDADDGDLPFDGTGDDFTTSDGCEAPWVEALDAIGELYSTSETLPSDLSPFDLIIYVGGMIDFAGTNIPMTDDEALALTAFMDAGGDVYVEEPRFGSVYYQNGSAVAQELWSRFHSTYVGGLPKETGNVQTLSGVSGGPGEGMSFAYDYTAWPDQLLGEVDTDGSAGGALMWSDQGGKPRGSVYVDGSTGSRRYMSPVMLGGMADGAYPSTRLDYVTAIMNGAGLIGTTGVGDASGVPANRLYQNAPNPFNPTTTIRYSVARDGARVSLSVYDVNGRLVETLRNETSTAGDHSVTWTGLNSRGERVASGIYFCRVSVDGWEASRKMVLLK